LNVWLLKYESGQTDKRTSRQARPRTSHRYRGRGNKNAENELAATLRGSRPGVQSTSLYDNFGKPGKIRTIRSKL